MSAHTPGPWQFYELGIHDGLGYIRPNPEDGKEIAHHGDTDRSRSENLANACLTAAAPDLLTALKDMLAGWRYIREHHGDLYGVGWDRAQGAAEAAIAKAGGETS